MGMGKKLLRKSLKSSWRENFNGQDLLLPVNFIEE